MVPVIATHWLAMTKGDNGGINVGNIRYAAWTAPSPSILSRRPGRARLRLRDRQGIAVNDGRGLVGDRAALCQQRAGGFDARYRRADRLLRSAERAGQG